MGGAQLQPLTPPPPPLQNGQNVRTSIGPTLAPKAPQTCGWVQIFVFTPCVSSEFDGESKCLSKPYKQFF